MADFDFGHGNIKAQFPDMQLMCVQAGVVVRMPHFCFSLLNFMQ